MTHAHTHTRKRRKLNYNTLEQLEQGVRRIEPINWSGDIQTNAITSQTITVLKHVKTAPLTLTHTHTHLHKNTHTHAHGQVQIITNGKNRFSNNNNGNVEKEISSVIVSVDKAEKEVHQQCV